jgi:hypothetical protein
VHRSPGFLTSVLNGVNDDGSIIKEFEASHGTVTDMWKVTSPAQQHCHTLSDSHWSSRLGLSTHVKDSTHT